MYVPETSTQYVFLPVYGPPGVDLTQYPVQVALVPEDAGEPAPSAYQAADWVNGQAGLLISAGSFPPGDYMAWVQLTAGDEAPVVQSGRVRIGDGSSPAGTPGAPSATWVTSVNGDVGVVVLGAADVGALSLEGGALAGPLTLADDPDEPLQAATKQYVDAHAGGGGSGSFTQPFTSASTVTVTHNLGKYPAVTVTDTANDVVVGDIQYLSTAALTVTFSAPFSGTVYCN